ncbi:MAG TPA: Type 1 glutamine amidotransferase-like domain-containing protein [Candidatus Saccharimonadales bacterium]|nr:Type 1 glutamine amidotransferase-like domain-containing protein [Candidatus Saccharimonadales bacterium]
MKLLLTSSGVSNRTIAKALLELVGKTPSETKIGFVPIALNVEQGNKDWVVNQFLTLWRHGYNWIDIVDPTAAGVDWQERLKEVDVIYPSGGNTFHLLDQARKTGFDKWLKNNLKNKVYVGGSASTILLSPNIGVAGIDKIDPNLSGLTDLTGLGLVDFEIVVHVPSMISSESAEKYAKKSKNRIYIFDDETALKIDGKKIEVVTEGSWKTYK